MFMINTFKKLDCIIPYVFIIYKMVDEDILRHIEKQDQYTIKILGYFFRDIP